MAGTARNYIYLLYRDADPLWRYVGIGTERAKTSYCRWRLSMRERKADGCRIIYRHEDREHIKHLEDRIWVALTSRGYDLPQRRPKLVGWPHDLNVTGKYVRTAEHRRAMRELHLGRQLSPEHRAKIREGLSSDAAKARMSQSQLVAQNNPETRRKKSIGRRGKLHTAATREKMRASQKRAQNTLEAKARMSRDRRGRTLTEAHKAKLRKPKPSGFGAKVSAARVGFRHSEETKQKLREKALARGTSSQISKEET